MMDLKTIIIVAVLSLAFFVEALVQKQQFILRNFADINDKTVDDDWWRTAIFYQIYPMSFKDSNGDGIGDLQGIITKLNHLKDMGVSAAWLSPINKSPGVDQGYDISDYRDIDPIFGNLSDLESLVNKAHAIGIKIIMDFVPDYTSDQHYWFQQSVKKNDPYTDYYIWAGSKKEEPPNNWLSIFGGSAWEWNEERKQFYYHVYTTAQPDLNYRNSKVVEEIKDVLKFWLDFGIDGFRLDSAPLLFESLDLRDEPLSDAAAVASTPYGRLKHIYTTHLDETYDMIYQFRAVLDTYNKDQNYSRILMTEAYTETAEQQVRYYGNDSTNGSHFTFNFNFITDLPFNFSIDQIISTTNKWLSHLDKKYVSNWVLGNHDQHRVTSRLGVDTADALNMLTAFLPGVQVTYMGEEIGMEDGNVTCDQAHDPIVINNCSLFDRFSRDFERTPFQWDDSDNAGFSTNSSTWLPVSGKYNTTNLKVQNAAGIKSHYNVYKDMVKFRQNFKNISYDAVSLIKLSDNVLQIVRKTDKDEYVYIFNNGANPETVNIYSDDTDFEVAVASVNSQQLVGDALSNPVNLQAYESVVLKVKTQDSGTNTLLSKWILTLLSILFLVQFF